MLDNLLYSDGDTSIGLTYSDKNDADDLVNLMFLDQFLLSEMDE